MGTLMIAGRFGDSCRDRLDQQAFAAGCRLLQDASPHDFSWTHLSSQITIPADQRVRLASYWRRGIVRATRIVCNSLANRIAAFGFADAGRSRSGLTTDGK
jgi:hypothetical protein